MQKKKGNLRSAWRRELPPPNPPPVNAGRWCRSQLCSFFFLFPPLSDLDPSGLRRPVTKVSANQRQTDPDWKTDHPPATRPPDVGVNQQRGYLLTADGWKCLLQHMFHLHITVE